GDGAADKWHEDIPVPKKKRLWDSWEGMAVMSMGVALPLFIGACIALGAPKRIALVLLNHPPQTPIEMLLIVGIPFINYRVGSSLCKDDTRMSRGRGIALGAGVGTALVVAAICIAALLGGDASLEQAIGTSFVTGFCCLALLSSAAGAVSLYLV